MSVGLDLVLILLFLTKHWMQVSGACGSAGSGQCVCVVRSLSSSLQVSLCLSAPVGSGCRTTMGLDHKPGWLFMQIRVLSASELRLMSLSWGETSRCCSGLSSLCAEQVYTMSKCCYVDVTVCVEDFSSVKICVVTVTLQTWG